jgi:hypothetical protein
MKKKNSLGKRNRLRIVVMCSICSITNLCLNNRAITPLHTADKYPEEDLLQSGNT